MEENQKEDQQPPKTNLLPAVVKSKAALDMTKVHGNYHQVLRTVLETEVNEQNFEESQALIKKVNQFLTFADEHRKEEKEPYLTAGRVIDAAHKEFSQPFEEAKQSLQQKLNIVGRRMEEEALKAKKEKERIEGLVGLVNQFVLDASVTIASAATNEQLIQIERLVNLEKANKSKYQDHLPLLIERCNELTGKIKEQKDLIKEKEKVEQQQKAAYESGNDQQAMELKEKSEKLEQRMQENNILVQETASKSVILTEIVPPEIDMPATRHKTWKFTLVDAKEVMKKNPDLLKVELDHKKTTDVLKTLKDTGILAGKSEYVLNGVRFYQDKTF